MIFHYNSNIYLKVVVERDIAINKTETQPYSSDKRVSIDLQGALYIVSLDAKVVHND